MISTENKRLKLCKKCHVNFTVRRKHHIPFCRECGYPIEFIPRFYRNGKPILNKNGNQKYNRVPYTKEEFKEWLKDYPQKRWL